jgi:hypothetical protein
MTVNSSHPRSRRVLTPILALALTAAASARVAELPALREAQAHQQALAQDLREAIEQAGGRRAILACGTPYVGPLRGPLAAYHLGVTKRTVEPDAPPQAPGVVFKARLTRASPPAPQAPPPFRRTARVGEWEVLTRCS